MALIRFSVSQIYNLSESKSATQEEYRRTQEMPHFRSSKEEQSFDERYSFIRGLETKLKGTVDMVIQ